MTIPGLVSLKTTGLCLYIKLDGRRKKGDGVPYRLHLKSVEGVPIPSFVVNKNSKFTNVNKRKPYGTHSIFVFNKYYTQAVKSTITFTM
jgi:hypothetical protein